MKSLAEELLPKRDLMAKVIKDAGMTPIIPEGGYFMLADWRDLGKKQQIKLITNSSLSIFIYLFFNFFLKHYRRRSIKGN